MNFLPYLRIEDRIVFCDCPLSDHLTKITISSEEVMIRTVKGEFIYNIDEDVLTFYTDSMFYKPGRILYKNSILIEYTDCLLSGRCLHSGTPVRQSFAEKVIKECEDICKEYIKRSLLILSRKNAQTDN